MLPTIELIACVSEASLSPSLLELFGIYQGFSRLNMKRLLQKNSGLNKDFVCELRRRVGILSIFSPNCIRIGKHSHGYGYILFTSYIMVPWLEYLFVTQFC